MYEKEIIISKNGNAIENYIAFAISSDLTALALSESDGTVRIIKSKNFITDFETKETFFSQEKSIIINIFFFRNELGLHMFYTTKKNCVWCY